MKSNVKALFLWFLLLVSISTRVYAQFAPTKPSVSFKVTRVVWGDNIDNPIKAHPGDSEVPLTIEVQNLSPNQTIKGVIGILILNDGPLEDVYGNSNVTATGEPEISEVLSPTDEIKPKGFFTLTFTLDIQNDALPGRYSYNMVIEYSVNCSGIFLDGESKTVTIDVIISKIESTISCSVSPKSVEKGELVKVSGSIEPTQENVTVTLEYKSPEGSIFTRTVRTDAEGSYEDSFIPHVEGYWSVNASWSGDEKHKGAWSAASFEVRFPVSLDIYVSKNRVVGGFNNDINVTITNSGKVALTEVELTINLPSPLIIQGDNKWRLEYLSPGNSSYIIISLFAPSSVIGSTYTASLSIDYRDDYGESHSETYPIGLIVVGWIDLVVYGKSVSPQPAQPGSKVSFTATILNKGNVVARYVNASLKPNPILQLTEESMIYVGDIEENSPAPFTLIAWIKDDVPEGVYPIKIIVTYRDDQYIDHSLNFTIYLSVEKSSQTTSGSAGSLTPSYVEIAVVTTLTAAASIVIIILYKRHMNPPKTI